MASIADRIQLVRQESAKLSGYLGQLAPDRWQRQSACDRWQVGDVVAHLIGGAQLYCDSIARGLKGHTSPGPGRPPPGSVDSAMLGEAIAALAVSSRQRLGDRLLDAFNTSSEQLHRLFEGLCSEDWDKLCYHPVSLFPARFFADLRLFELTFHGWDIRSGVESRAILSPEPLSVIVPMIAELAGRLITADLEPGHTATHRFRLTGAVSRDYDLSAGANGVIVSAAGSSMPDATIRCDAGHFGLLMTGRLDFDAGVAEGRLVLEGSSALHPEFGSWFKGVLRPGPAVL